MENRLKPDEPREIRQDEELDVARLNSYLQAHFKTNALVSVEQFPSGFSNLTYLIRCGADEWVLRRPPFGNQVKSAHDMKREFRVLSRLEKVYPPAPKPILFCDDHSILGDDFYLMERRRGVILRGANPPDVLAKDAKLARSLSESFVDNLVRLHQLDLQAAGLADFGKPENYINRQISGWNKRYGNARTDDQQQVEALGEWLSQNIPQRQAAAIIHNDFKYDNLILNTDDLTKVIAVLDWEMATIGDPWMDLGSTLAYWIEPTDSKLLRDRAFGPTMLPGSLTRREIVDRYSEVSGVEVENPLFYFCYGLFKLAVIVQQIYARFARGVTQDPRFAQLNHIVEALGESAVNAIENESI